jgi:nucleoside-diphosphate-sugar epimerase
VQWRKTEVAVFFEINEARKVLGLEQAGYNESFEVDEEWRPLPTIASAGLSDHLGEFTCREFSREGKLNVVVLRLGNIMQAAVRHHIQRIINTGPHFTIAGPSYERFDHAISPDLPPHPGTGLYPLTKSLGQEICRAFTLTHDIYVQEYLFYGSSG